jgi:glutaredoxin
MSGRSCASVCAFLLLLLAGAACERGETGPQGADEASPETPKSLELPALELRDDTKNLLLTWVDDQGDFHVVEKVSDVPENGRAQVRVVVTSRPEGTGKLVYVAELTKKRADGTYAVRTMTRAQWDEVGASKRKARLEAIAPSAKPPAAPPSPDGAKGVSAIVYGADWCKPCHDAERFLKGLGVQVTKKDIEASAAAHKEMQAKLIRANRPGASIPVIDVNGTVIVGYNPGALKRIVEDARRAETL